MSAPRYDAMKANLLPTVTRAGDLCFWDDRQVGPSHVGPVYTTLPRDDSRDGRGNYIPLPALKTGALVAMNLVASARCSLSAGYRAHRGWHSARRDISLDNGLVVRGRPRR